MRSEWRATVLRTDVRLALLITVLLGLFLAVAFFSLYSFAAEEAVESADLRLEREIRALAELLEQKDLAENPTLLRLTANRAVEEGIALRVYRHSDTPLFTLGQWPASGRAIGLRPRGAETVLYDSSDYIVHSRTLDGGIRISGAGRLDAYIYELREIRNRLLAWYALALLGALATAVVSVRMAFHPLLRTTQAVEAVDESNLAQRLPVRGAGDEIDRHAHAVNRVLQRLQNSFERMRAFTGDVAHELRTPVNRILNVSDVALLDSSDPERLRRALQTLRETGESMQLLVYSLLLLARGEEGQLVPETSSFDLGDASRRMVELYRPMCEEKNIRIEHSGSPARVLADPALTERSLANLLDNAFRHTPDGGTISVSVTQSGSYATLIVADSGTGVPVDCAELIFKRFVRLDPARSGRGAGLGLPIARMLARIQRGDIRMVPGRLPGAAFELRLPLA